MTKPSKIDVIKSVLAAAIGVQSDKNRKKDFEQGNLSSYIVAGLIFTMVFVILISIIVSTVVPG